MAPKMCVLVALNVVVLFALVTATSNTSVKNTNTTKNGWPTDRGCPRDVLKLGVCSGILNGWINFTTGLPPKTKCCSSIRGLDEFEVAVCICTALRANIMGYNIDIPISFTELINTCDRKVPNDFICT